MWRIRVPRVASCEALQDVAAFADLKGRITATIGAQYEEGARFHTAIRENLARLGYRVGKEDAP